jgi:hypothetical protein
VLDTKVDVEQRTNRIKVEKKEALEKEVKN